MKTLIVFALSNFTLTFLLLGLIVAGISMLARRGNLTHAAAIDILMRNYLLFAVALTYFYNFVMHVFFGEMTARFIGWENSPFQAEVGFASLGYALVGLLAMRGGYGLRLAAIVGPAIFLLGAAGGHIVQMVVAHNYAPGNAGIIFYTDIIVPLLGFVLLWLARPAATGRVPAAA